VLRLLIRKLFQGIVLILLTTAVTFFLLAAAGGDAFSSLRDNPQVSERTIEQLRKSYGLDRPVSTRYLSWLGGALTADLGESFYFKTPVSSLVASRFAATALMSLAALAFAVAIALVLSFLQVRYRSSLLAKLIEGVVLISASMPRIVLGLAGLLIAVTLAVTSTFWIAAVALAVPLIAAFLAQFHDSLVVAMSEDYVRTARAKGLTETAVILRHAFRGAINPSLTLLGVSLGGLLGGSVIVEAIFGIQGIGSLMVLAVRNRDIPLIMGIMVITSLAVWAGNAIAEALQLLNDRRLRTAETE